MLWQRARPGWQLVLPCETTQLIGTLAGVYAAYRMLEHRSAKQSRHLRRIEGQARA